MPDLYDAIINSPVAKLGIKTHEDTLVGLKMLSKDASLKKPSTPLAKRVIEQLEAYFNKESKYFDLPIRFEGTPFQAKVWQALKEIEIGKKKTYSDLARALSTGPRAVGNACRSNNLVIIVPCHRVVAKNGLGGFSGETSGEWPSIKKWLLEHEQLF